MNTESLISKLKKLGFNPIISNNEFKPIRNVLRDSWYVNKIVELGYKECVHIDLGMSFIAILDDEHIMSGGNCMISNCFECMTETTNLSMEDIISIVGTLNVKFYGDDEDNLVIFTLDTIDECIELSNENN